MSKKKVHRITDALFLFTCKHYSLYIGNPFYIYSETIGDESYGNQGSSVYGFGRDIKGYFLAVFIGGGRI